jgi:hypothetical protein
MAQGVIPNVLVIPVFDDNEGQGPCQEAVISKSL